MANIIIRLRDSSNRPTSSLSKAKKFGLYVGRKAALSLRPFPRGIKKTSEKEALLLSLYTYLYDKLKPAPKPKRKQKPKKKPVARKKRQLPYRTTARMAERMDTRRRKLAFLRSPSKNYLKYIEDIKKEELQPSKVFYYVPEPEEPRKKKRKREGPATTPRYVYPVKSKSHLYEKDYYLKHLKSPQFTNFGMSPITENYQRFSLIEWQSNIYLNKPVEVRERTYKENFLLLLKIMAPHIQQTLRTIKFTDKEKWKKRLKKKEDPDDYLWDRLGIIVRFSFVTDESEIGLLYGAKTRKAFSVPRNIVFKGEKGIILNEPTIRRVAEVFKDNYEGLIEDEVLPSPSFFEKYLRNAYLMNQRPVFYFDQISIQITERTYVDSIDYITKKAVIRDYFETPKK